MQIDTFTLTFFSVARLLSSFREMSISRCYIQYGYCRYFVTNSLLALLVSSHLHALQRLELPYYRAELWIHIVRPSMVYPIIDQTALH